MSGANVSPTGRNDQEMNLSSLIESVKSRFPDAVLASHTHRGDATVILRAKFLLEMARFLKEDPAFKMNLLVDITAVDYSTFGKRPAPAFFATASRNPDVLSLLTASWART